MKSTYDLRTNDERLELRTDSFRTGHGSVLHSGIYNSELVASLAAAAILVAAFVVALAAGVKVTAAYYIAGTVVFFVLLFMFRKFVFFEEFLSAAIDRGTGTVSVEINKALPDRKVFKLTELEAVRLGKVHIKPENPDGVDFVKKISLQHGVDIPGFGVEKHLCTVELEFTGGRKAIVFSSEDESEALGLRDKLAGFVGGGVAQED